MKTDNNHCNLCNSHEFELVKDELRDDKTKFKVYKCNSCGHIQLLPRPKKEEDRKFYNGNLQDKSRGKEIDYEKLRGNNMFDTSRHVKLIQELCTDFSSSIVDVGSGYGFFVNELHRAGYKNVIGVEISEERRKIAQRNSLVTFIDYDVNMPDKDIRKYNIVTLFHTLEHMADPVVFLQNIKKLINQDGIFICEVPNVNEMLLANCSEYNDFYWIRAHLNYFSRDTLSMCLQRAGYGNFEIRFEQRYGLLNLCNWLATGRPQIEKPIFEILEAYRPVESYYKQHVESLGKSDAIIAIARLK